MRSLGKLGMTCVALRDGDVVDGWLDTGGGAYGEGQFGVRCFELLWMMADTTVTGNSL